ncbi:MAG: hypothetical protein COB17_03305 [Sulfurimonas sp.]|nr:MAG: hypothetical protein COB17_03305 [Sulfurimonas sp.]
MSKVKIQNACSCVLKCGMAEVQEFDTSESAKKEAEKMFATMNREFCSKHDFTLTERFGDFTIFIKARR